jgi:hypothetical protein
LSDDVNYTKAFFGFWALSSLAMIPAALAQVAKQHMSATPLQILGLCLLIGFIVTCIAASIFRWHRGSRRALITALIVIAAFAFFGWRGGTGS